MAEELADVAEGDAAAEENLRVRAGMAHSLNIGNVRRELGFEGVEVYAAEIDLGKLLTLARDEIDIRPLPRLPAVERDLALIVRDTIGHDVIAASIRAAAGPLLETVTLFDVYRGAPVPEEHRSLAFALTFRSPDRTLTEDEVAAAMTAIERQVTAQFAATVRGK